jgi:hypothetical protein
MKHTILDRDLAEQMIADLRDQADHTLENCNSRQCIHFTLDRIADQFANALAELRRVEPVNDSNSTATWVRHYTRLERAVDAMNAGVPADEDWATERELRKLRKRVAELDALETAAAHAVDALESIGEQVKAQRDSLAGWCRYALEHWAPEGSGKAEAMQAELDAIGVKP